MKKILVLQFEVQSYLLGLRAAMQLIKEENGR